MELLIVGILITIVFFVILYFVIKSAVRDGIIESRGGKADEEDSGISKVECPNCGKSYDMDYPKCPHC